MSMGLKVIFMMILIVLVAMLLNQLPDYILGTYSNYIALAICGFAAVIILLVGSKR